MATQSVQREDYRKGRKFKQEIRNPGFEGQARAYMATVSPVAGKGDYSDIQTAIDDLYNEYGFARVLLLEGTFNPSSDLTLYSNTLLSSVDNDLCIIDFDNADYWIKAHGSSSSHKRNIYLKNIQVINSDLSDFGAIDFNYVDDCSVISCKFENNYDEGAGNGGDISFRNSKICRARSNYSYNSGDFCYENNSVTVEVSNNNVEDGQMGGIISINGENVKVFGNTFDNLYSLVVYIDSNDFKFTHNTVLNASRRGIRVVNASVRAQIAFNDLEGSNTAYPAIQLFSRNDDCMVNHNNIIGSWDKGIELINSDNVDVSFNRITGSDDAIIIDSDCDETRCGWNDTSGSTNHITDNGNLTELAHNVS